MDPKSECYDLTGFNYNSSVVRLLRPATARLRQRFVLNDGHFDIFTRLHVPYTTRLPRCCNSTVQTQKKIKQSP